MTILLQAAWLLAGLAPPLSLLPFAPGEPQIYEAQLQAGEFLHLELAQEGVDLEVRVTGPGGELLLEVDHPFDLDLPESLALVAAETGTYRFAVSPAATAGAWQVLAWRMATPADRLRAEAGALTQAAHGRADQRDADSLRAAAQDYRAAHRLWNRLGDRREEARCLRRLGQLQQRLGDGREALATLGEALALERADGQSDGVAATLNEIGRAHRSLGANEEAVAVYEEALALWQAAGDTAAEASVHNNLGAALLALGQLRQALPHYERALAIFRSRGDRLRETAALVNLGHLHGQLGQGDRAVAAYEEALVLAAPLERPDLEADVRNNLGVALLELGEPHAALEQFGSALTVYRRLGDGRRQAAALNSQGTLLLDLGLPEAARQRLLEAAELLRRQSDPYLESRVLLGLGTAARDLGQSAEATARFAAAVEVQRRTGDRGGEARSLYHQAVVRLHEGRSAAALELARQALGIFEQSSEPGGRSQALRVAGMASAALGRVAEARDALEQAAALGEAAGSLTDRLAALRELGRLERDQKRPEQALAHLQRALEMLESLRARISGESLKASYFATVREIYELTLDTLMELHRARPGAGHARRAFALSEQARARALLDVLGRARVDARKEGAEQDPGLLAEQRRLRRQLNALDLQRRRRGDPEGTLAARMAELSAEYRLLEGRLLPPAAAPLGGFASPQHFLDESRALLDGDTVLLEIALGEPRSHLWILSRGGLESFELPGRSVLEAAAERVHRLLGEPASSAAERRQVEAELEALSRLVLAPAFGRPERRWVIVPDGALHYVPFAALPVPAPRQAPWQPLMVEHEVVHLPSVAVLAELRRTRRAPAAGRQVIASLWPVRDRATAELMQRFYRGLLRQGQSPAAALREAQLALWQERRWRDPHFWAPFILVGDWQAVGWQAVGWQAVGVEGKRP